MTKRLWIGLTIISIIQLIFLYYGMGLSNMIANATEGMTGVYGKAIFLGLPSFAIIILSLVEMSKTK